MPFVIDASVAASWLLPDEGHEVAATAYRQLLTDHALVPGLWWFEMRNLFIVNERRGRLDSDKTSRALTLRRSFPSASIMPPAMNPCCSRQGVTA